MLFQTISYSRAHRGGLHAGKDWLMDTEYGHAPPEAGQAYLGMLAIDSLLGVSAALETLTDRALGPEGSEPGVHPQAVSSLDVACRKTAMATLPVVGQ